MHITHQHATNHKTQRSPHNHFSVLSSTFQTFSETSSVNCPFIESTCTVPFFCLSLKSTFPLLCTFTSPHLSIIVQTSLYLLSFACESRVWSFVSSFVLDLFCVCTCILYLGRHKGNEQNSIHLNLYWISFFESCERINKRKCVDAKGGQ